MKRILVELDAPSRTFTCRDCGAKDLLEWILDKQGLHCPDCADPQVHT